VHIVGDVVYRAVEANDVFAVEGSDEGLVELFVDAVSYLISTVLKLVKMGSCLLNVAEVVAKIAEGRSSIQSVVGGILKPLVEVAVVPFQEIKQRHGAGPLVLDFRV
jgi:hypothetical protein